MGASAAMDDVPVIGIPKTIDNDIGGTDASIGFWTAAQIATDSIDRLYSTAESHNRVMVCEVMGRSAGWIGITAGLAGGCRRDRHPRAPVRHRARLPRGSDGCIRSAARSRSWSSRRAPHRCRARWTCPSTRSMRTAGRGSEASGSWWPMRSKPAYALRDPRHDARPRAARRDRRSRSTACWPRAWASRPSTRRSPGRWGNLVGIRGADIVTTPLVEVGARASVVPPERFGIPEILCT